MATNAYDMDPIAGLTRRTQSERDLRKAWSASSNRFKGFVAACAAASGVAVSLLVAGSGSETAVEPVDATPAPIERVIVTPEAFDDAPIAAAPDCSPAGKAVAAYVGRQATIAFEAACDPTAFAAQALASNR